MNTQSENISDINSKDIMYATEKEKPLLQNWLKKDRVKYQLMGKI